MEKGSNKLVFREDGSTQHAQNDDYQIVAKGGNRVRAYPDAYLANSADMASVVSTANSLAGTFPALMQVPAPRLGRA